MGGGSPPRYLILSNFSSSLSSSSRSSCSLSSLAHAVHCHSPLRPLQTLCRRDKLSLLRRLVDMHRNREQARRKLTQSEGKPEGGEESEKERGHGQVEGREVERGEEVDRRETGETRLDGGGDDWSERGLGECAVDSATQGASAQKNAIGKGRGGKEEEEGIEKHVGGEEETMGRIEKHVGGEEGEKHGGGDRRTTGRKVPESDVGWRDRKEGGKRGGRRGQKKRRRGGEDVDAVISADLEELSAMGFSKRRAEDAVLAVGPGNVERALEWLLRQ